jgi:hypothetical protein
MMVNLARFCALVLALLVAAEASAQMGGKRGGRGGSRGEAKGAKQERVDLFQATAEELRTDLNLSDKQAPLWDA